MNKYILFIQGGGEGGYEADIKMVASLEKALGPKYEICYPKIQSDESASDFGWPQQIAKKISEIKSDLILVGHSFGASMILKCLSENAVNKKIEGIFLIATPFWSLKLQEDFADKLSSEVPIFFYHCHDDEEVPFSQMTHYKQKVAQATFREIGSGGHQLNNDLTIVANDIKFSIKSNL